MNAERIRSRLAAGAAVLTMTAGVLIGLSAPASAIVSGLEIVSAVSAEDSSDFKGVSAYCSNGKQPVGTGAKITGGSGDVRLTSISPLPTSVWVAAHEDEDGTTSDWKVKAYAICADPVAGMTIETDGTGQNSQDKQVIVTCPTGTKAIGVGAHLFTGLGAMGQVTIDDVARTSTTVTAMGLEDDNGTTDDWAIRVDGICAPAPDGFEVVTAYSPSDSISPKTVTAECPLGKRLIASSYHITGGSGEVGMVDVIPGHDSLTVTGVEDDDGTANTWSVISHAHCVTAIGHA